MPPLISMWKDFNLIMFHINQLDSRVSLILGASLSALSVRVSFVRCIVLTRVCALLFNIIALLSGLESRCWCLIARGL